MKKPKGFIVHPFETGNNMFHSSFGNHNKTVKSFKTLRDAKKYLVDNKVKGALYDAPQGVKVINLVKPRRVRKPKKKINSVFDLF